MSLSLGTVTLETFTPHLGSEFVITLSNGECLRFQLADIKPLGEGVAGGRHPFSLLFTHPVLPNQAYLPQRIYLLEHPVLENLEIFLVPLNPEKGAMRYEAIFT